MTVHAQPAYQIRPVLSAAPAGYPAQPVLDTYSEQPILTTYAERKAAFFQHVLRNPAPANTKPAWYELVRMAAGGEAHEGVFGAACDFIDERKDCADFVLHGILRLLYQFDPRRPFGKASTAQLAGSVYQRARQSVLRFKYFPDEPGIDSLCTWTENHYILYTTAAYLAGQLYPEETFYNSGHTGSQKMALNRSRILRWLELRFHTGFSEWLSHVYYDEDLTALLAIYDFADDPELRQRAGLVLNLLVYDIALNSFRGVFGSTHGRAYENTKKWASNEGTSDTCKLLFGMGVYSGFDNMSAAAFALSSYTPPAVLETVATAPRLENWQRMGIRLAEMGRWGLRADNFEDGMHFLTLEAYLHPLTIENTIDMFDICNWWDNFFLHEFKNFRGVLKALRKFGWLPGFIKPFERDVCRNTREQVNIYTCRTPDYMLSTAQDYRPGYGGDQQHIWQATLGPDAVCFTTHPARLQGETPNYWSGSGLLPRAAQYKNVVVAVYNLEKIPALYVPIRHFFTHAWLPKDKFDEIEEHAGWIFARRGTGFLALHSQKPYFWNEKATAQADAARYGIKLRGGQEEWGREVVAPGKQNIWICQLGSEAENGSFAAFIAAVRNASIRFADQKVAFESPGNGLLEFGWKGDLRLNGKPVELHPPTRYTNPFSQTEFGADLIQVQSGGHALRLDWNKPATGEIS